MFSFASWTDSKRPKLQFLMLQRCVEDRATVSVTPVPISDVRVFSCWCCCICWCCFCCCGSKTVVDEIKLLYSFNEKLSICYCISDSHNRVAKCSYFLQKVCCQYVNKIHIPHQFQQSIFQPSGFWELYFIVDAVGFTTASSKVSLGFFLFFLCKDWRIRLFIIFFLN